LQNDEILLRIYNVGAGVEYHGEIPLASGKIGHFPVFGLLIPKSSDIKTCIVELLKPQCLPYFNNIFAQLNQGTPYIYNEGILYKEIIPSLSLWLKAKIINSNELSNPVLGQRSGTCVPKVLKQIQKSFFADKISFNLFVLSYRLYLLNKSSTDFDLNALEQDLPGARKVLIHCVENTVRMLDTDLKKESVQSKLTKIDLECILEYLNTYKNKIREIPYQKNRLIGNNCAYVIHPVEGNDVSLSNLSIIPLVEKNSTKRISFERGFLQALSEITERMDKFEEEAYCYLIEKFCFNYSDPKNTLLIEENSNIEFEKVIENLNHILSKYELYRPRLTPRSTIIHIAFMFLLDRLCEEKFFKMNENFHLTCAPFYQHEIANFLERIKKNVFIGTQDFKLDLLLERIRNFYQEKIATHPDRGDLVQHYCKLVDNGSPEEIEVVKKKWIQQDSSSDKEKKELIEKFFSIHNVNESYYYSFLSTVKNREESEYPDDKNSYYDNSSFSEEEKNNKSDVISIECHYTLDRFMNLQLSLESFFVRSQQFILHQPDKSSFKIIYDDRTKKVQYDNILLSNTNWYLKLSLYNDFFHFQNVAIRNPLLSGYDGSQKNSNEIPFALSESESFYLRSHLSTSIPLAIENAAI
jgi:hypothetical protein